MKQLLVNLFQFLEKYNRPVIIGWFLLCTLLLLLPGNESPIVPGFLAHIYFDKWVHAGIFGSLTFLFLFLSKKRSHQYLIIILIGLYGYIIEWIQKLFIPYRSFDLNDVAADIAGCIIGLLLYRWLAKKVNPCGNRGRNQN